MKKTKNDDFPIYYEIKYQSRPGIDGREKIPLAIPFDCAHSGDETGILNGKKPREQVLKLLSEALPVTNGNTWKKLTDSFSSITEETYDKAREISQKSKKIRQGTKIRFQGTVTSPHKQFDKHAQIIFRLFDQDRKPINHFDVFFDAAGENNERIGSLIEDKHRNRASENIITFYLRSSKYDEEKNDWISEVQKFHDGRLEIWGEEPETPDHIIYLPFHIQLDNETIKTWISDHQTTIIDVELLRIPLEKVLQIKTFSE